MIIPTLQKNTILYDTSYLIIPGIDTTDSEENTFFV